MPRRYLYVGPAELGVPQGEPAGTAIRSADDLAGFLSGCAAPELAEPFTFIVDLADVLRLAPRRSEHVACAGGHAVLAAGEMSFARSGVEWVVNEITNQSTGYCPDEQSWHAVAAALQKAGLAHLDGFTTTIIFRRCPTCGERNIVKDEEFICTLCDGPLPAHWNFDEP